MVFSLRGLQALRGPARLYAAIFFIGQILCETLHERIWRTFRGVDERVAFLVVFLQFLACSLLALALSMAKARRKDSGEDIELGEPLSKRYSTYVRELIPYALIGALSWCSNGFSSLAVAHVDYVVKVIFKCSKLVPTMAVALVLGNARRFSRRECLAALLLCAGTGLFSAFSARAPRPHADDGERPRRPALGLFFCIASVAGDGLLPNLQQRLMRSGVTAEAMMLRVNLLGLLGSIFTLVIPPSNLSYLFALILEQPSLLAHAMGVSFALASAVYAWTHLVNQAGSVAAVGIATLRKFCTVAASYMIYGGQSWSPGITCSLAMVCAGTLISDGAKKGDGGPSVEPPQEAVPASETKPLPKGKPLRRGELHTV